MKKQPLILIILALIACESPNGKTYENFELDEDMAVMEEIIEIPATHQLPPPQESEPQEIIKRVVKTGGLEFESEDIEQDYRKIRQLLPKYDAYIENENQNRSAHRIDYNLTIRVPSNVYDTLYGSISKLAFRLDNKYSNAEDVTERYYDLQTRLKNKKALETRYVQLLDKARAIKDILEIERNINHVRTEIERLQGQFNYLSKQVRFSTIHLSFYEVLPYVYDSSQREGFGARILSALDDGWQWFLSLLVGLVSLWPFVFLIAGVVFLYKKIKKNRSK